MHIEVHPEVRSEHQREPPLPLLVREEVRANHRGLAPVQGQIEPVRGAVRGERSSNRGRRRISYNRTVSVPSNSSRREQAPRPQDDGVDKVMQVDAPSKRLPRPGRSSHLAGVFFRGAYCTMLYRARHTMSRLACNGLPSLVL